MDWSSERVDRYQVYGVFVILAAVVVALIAFPEPLTAAVCIVVTGGYVMLTQVRELSK